MQIGYGFRRVMDAQQTYTQAGLPVYLRLRNFAPVQNQAWAQYGFAIAPSGSVAVGTEDVIIQPQPSNKLISQHNIAMSNGKLRFGAREFVISHSFVLQMMDTLGLSDPTLVWRGPQTVGLVTEGLLFDIVQYPFDTLGGDIIEWILQANGNEVR